jgi:hypothetical protein
LIIHTNLSIILLLLLSLCSCKKKDVQPQPPLLEGQWRLVAAQSNTPGIDSEIKDTQIAIFQQQEYRILVNDLQLNATTYHLELAETTAGKQWKIITTNAQMAYVKIINDSLYINRTDDEEGNALIYVRAQPSHALR